LFGVTKKQIKSPMAQKRKPSKKKPVMPTDDKSEADSKFRIALAKTVKRVPAGYERDECNQAECPTLRIGPCVSFYQIFNKRHASRRGL
jgi:hypothetical protein